MHRGYIFFPYFAEIWISEFKNKKNKDSNKNME